MGKSRGRKRKAKKRKKGRQPQGPPVRALDLGPIKVIQQGNYVGIQADPDHPDYEAFRKAQREAATDLPQQLLKHRQDLADLMAPHHAFDVVFNVWGTYGHIRPGTLKPIAEDSLPATAEFVAHVLLDRPSPGPLRAPTNVELRQGVNPKEVGGLVARMVVELPILFTQRQIGDSDELDPWTDLRARLYMHRLAVRSFTYVEQETQTLKELFEPFDDELSAMASLTIAQALALAYASGELPMERAAERAARARMEAEKLRRAVAARRAGKPVKNEYGERLVEQLVAQSPRDSDKWIVAMTASWAWHGFGRVAAFTAEDLASHSGVDVSAAQTFLDLFSVEFGKREDAGRWQEDPERALGGEMEVMRANPILHDGDGRYLPCALDSIFYGLRDKLTSILKGDPKVWQRFDSHRGRLIEERALLALSDKLGADWAHGSVKYSWLGENGEQHQGEADGILRIDSLVVLVETKAGALAPSARRTAPDRLERGLRDLVEAAAEQLGRAERALVDGEATQVTDHAGKPLNLDVKGVVRVLRVAVTLENLSAVAPAAWRLQEAGLLPAEEQAPWVVGIHELELICRLVDRPVQLVHYVLRRQRANRQRVWAMDEMDFFMRYLQDGLFWEDGAVEGSHLELHNHTDGLDAWWYGEQGLSKPAKRPRQRLNRATRQLLDDIEATGALGRVEAQLMILEMATPERERVAAGLRSLLRQTRADRQPHDATLIFGEDFGITLHSVPPDMRGIASERLADHGSMRMEKSNLRRWLGLAAVLDSGHRIDAMAIVVDLGRLVDEEPDRPLSQTAE